MLTTRVRVILSAGFLGAVMYVRGHAAGGSEEQDASAVQSAQAEWREEKDSNRVRDRPVIVPRELDELRLEVSVAAGPGYSRPRVEVAESGAVVITRSSGDRVTFQLGDDEATVLFQSFGAVVNQFYLADRRGRPYAAKDPKTYELRLSSGTRSVEVHLEQSQPSRMGLEPVFFSALHVVNRALRRQGAQDGLPDPFRLDKSYEDPSLERIRECIPDELPRAEWRLSLDVISEAQRVRMSLHPAGDQGTPIDRNLLTMYRGDAYVKMLLQPREAEEMYNCARTIINQFSLVSGKSARRERAGARIVIGIGANGREINVAFNSSEDIPGKWRQCLTRTIEIVNASMEPGQMTIEPFDK